jgi:hypothetical protein
MEGVDAVDRAVDTECLDSSEDAARGPAEEISGQRYWRF